MRETPFTFVYEGRGIFFHRFLVISFVSVRGCREAPPYLLTWHRLVIDEQKDEIDKPEDEVRPGCEILGRSDVFCERSFFHII